MLTKAKENLEGDQRKFEKVTLNNEAFVNSVVNKEKYVETIFKNLIDSNVYQKKCTKQWSQLCIGQVQCLDFANYINNK